MELTSVLCRKYFPDLRLMPGSLSKHQVIQRRCMAHASLMKHSQSKEGLMLMGACLNAQHRKSDQGWWEGVRYEMLWTALMKSIEVIFSAWQHRCHFLESQAMLPLKSPLFTCSMQCFMVLVWSGLHFRKLSHFLKIYTKCFSMIYRLKCLF